MPSPWCSRGRQAGGRSPEEASLDQGVPGLSPVLGTGLTWLPLQPFSAEVLRDNQTLKHEASIVCNELTFLCI